MSREEERDNKQIEAIVEQVLASDWRPLLIPKRCGAQKVHCGGGINWAQKERGIFDVPGTGQKSRTARGVSLGEECIGIESARVGGRKRELRGHRKTGGGEKDCCGERNRDNSGKDGRKFTRKEQERVYDKKNRIAMRWGKQSKRSFPCRHMGKSKWRRSKTGNQKKTERTPVGQQE